MLARGPEGPRLSLAGPHTQVTADSQSGWKWCCGPHSRRAFWPLGSACASPAAGAASWRSPCLYREVPVPRGPVLLCAG